MGHHGLPLHQITNSMILNRPTMGFQLGHQGATQVVIGCGLVQNPQGAKALTSAAVLGCCQFSGHPEWRSELFAGRFVH